MAPDLPDRVGGKNRPDPPHVPAEPAGVGPDPLGEQLGEVGPQDPSHAGKPESDHDAPPEEEDRVPDHDIDPYGDGDGAESGDHGLAAANPVSEEPEELESEKHPHVHHEGEIGHHGEAEAPLAGEEGGDPV